MKTDADSRPEADLCAQTTISATRSVLLVGFMGAGKSSVGRALARRLGWKFEDLDERIESREKRTVQEIFSQSGETAFRQAEHVALCELLTEAELGPRVIALGGGAFVQTDNRSLVHEKKIPTVFLDAPVEELFRRCQLQGMERPLISDEQEFRKLYQSRRPIYMTATLQIETGNRKVDDIVETVVRSLGLLPSN